MLWPLVVRCARSVYTMRKKKRLADMDGASLATSRHLTASGRQWADAMSHPSLSQPPVICGQVYRSFTITIIRVWTMVLVLWPSRRRAVRCV